MLCSFHKNGPEIEFSEIAKIWLDKFRKMKYNNSRKSRYATVAQLVEQLIRNQQVAGSSPATSSKKTPQSDEFRSAAFYFYVLPGWAARLHVNQYGGRADSSARPPYIYSVSVGFGSVGGVLLFATGIKRFANLFLPRLHT